MITGDVWPVGHQESGEGRSGETARLQIYSHGPRCFTLYSSVCDQYTPELILELMAYLVFIIHVSREKSGLRWIWYDLLFQKHRLKKWLVINPTLYTSCVTGTPREEKCELCWATTPETRDCAHLMRTEPTIESHVQCIEELMQAMLLQRDQVLCPQLSSQICRKFNNGGCSYDKGWTSDHTSSNEELKKLFCPDHDYTML